MLKPMGMPSAQLRMGGLMRCCIGTWQVAEKPTEIGRVLQCQYSDGPLHRMILAPDGVWEWFHPDPSDA